MKQDKNIRGNRISPRGCDDVAAVALEGQTKSHVVLLVKLWLTCKNGAERLRLAPHRFPPVTILQVDVNIFFFQPLRLQGGFECNKSHQQKRDWSFGLI